MAEGVMVELQMSSSNYSVVLEEVVMIRKNIFPEYESVSRSFHDELNKKGSGLLYFHVNGEVAGYVLYSQSSLLAIILELADCDKELPTGSSCFRRLERIKLKVDIMLIMSIFQAKDGIFGSLAAGSDVVTMN